MAEAKYTKTVKQCEYCGKDFAGGKKTTCSRNCDVNLRSHKMKPMKDLKSTCRTCGTTKPFKGFYAYRNRPISVCKTCYDERYGFRLQRYLEYDRDFAVLHRLLKRVKYRQWNVTEYDEWQMLRIYSFYFPQKKLTRNPEKIKGMWYELIYYYRDCREKIIYQK